jgi:hypothetical protein
MRKDLGGKSGVGNTSFMALGNVCNRYHYLKTASLTITSYYASTLISLVSFPSATFFNSLVDFPTAASRAAIALLDQ